MAKQLYGYTTSTYGGGGGATTSLYSSRSGADSYLSADTSLLGTSSRYLSGDSLSSSSVLSSSLLYNPDSYSTRIPGVSINTPTHSYGPPGVDVSSTVTDLYAGLKRTSSEFGRRNGESSCEEVKFTGCVASELVPPVPSESLPERQGEPDCPVSLEDGDVSVLPERPSEPPCAILAGEENGTVVQNIIFGDAKTAQPPVSPALLHNSKGLPVRPGEEDCPFYLKTGSCKYGATCRYNHPERYLINPPAAAIAPTLLTSPSSHFNVGVVAPTSSLLSTFDPRLTQTMVNLKLSMFFAGFVVIYIYIYMSLWHLESRKTYLTSVHVACASSGFPLGLGSTIYPQRPGQLECDVRITLSPLCYYMKTGVCKFGNNCKFHHPIDRSTPKVSVTESLQQNVTLTLAGLPRREGAIHCPYYMKTGTCKYGATCKFDHPPPGEVMAIATSQPTSTSAVGEGKENGDA
ncbi:hypothetical protein DH2020_017105 [Rehmannia glutinosa]|uniref:C3H1-type domain-containing protein n=1 Tax=Rehmannia glutinosa TaxID=99300 RepID=A0ABR0WU71_REHGL